MAIADRLSKQMGARMISANQYNDAARAEAYAKLGIVNSYYLAYRDLPELFAKY
jgi:hypothetical protein